MLPFIDRVGRRNLLLVGSVTCMVVHFIIAGVMASKGNPVPNVNGNANLTWEIKGSAGMTVIAFSYIFTGIYGLTWVCYNSIMFVYETSSNIFRLLLHGFMPPRFSPLSIERRASACRPPPTGFSILLWLTLWHRPSTIFSGRPILFSGCSAL